MYRLFIRLSLLFLCKSVCVLNSSAQSIDSLVIYFDFDRSIPTANYSDTIKEFLLRKQTDSVLIVGHADSTGTEKYNLHLSKRRADWAREITVDIIGKKVPVLSVPRGETIQFQFPEKNRNVVIYSFCKDEIAEAPATFSKIDTSFTLDQIYFEPDKALLTPESVRMMPLLLKRMEKYKSDSIEIRGHVNQAGVALSNTDPLFRLSEQRARVIYHYFVDYGFDPARLSHRGMGNSQTKSTEELTKEEQRRNMRVELLIYKKSNQ